MAFPTTDYNLVRYLKTSKSHILGTVRSRDISITIKENPLLYSRMFLEQTALIGTYDTPINYDFHEDGSCQIWAPGVL